MCKKAQAKVLSFLIAILLYLDDAVGLDGDLCACFYVFEELIAQTVYNGHPCVRPHVAEYGARGCQRVNGL